ncbi:MAG: HAD family hydrolase [Halobaculum sp.]
MNYDAVVFDMDGVIVQRTPGWVFDEAAEETLTEFGVDDPTPFEFRAVRTLATTVKQAKKHFDEERGLDFAELWKARDELVTQKQEIAISHGEKDLYPDAQAIRSLDVPLGVVSNNLQQAVENAMTAFDMAPLFDVMYGLAPRLVDHSYRKPDATYLERALSDLDADSAVYVGDRRSDVEAAHEAGIDAALVRREFNQEISFDDPIAFDVDSLHEIVQQLDEE